MGSEKYGDDGEYEGVGRREENRRLTPLRADLRFDAKVRWDDARPR